MSNLIKFFCGKCKKLLCKGHIVNGVVEVKCKCGMTNTFGISQKIDNKESEGRKLKK